jgi:hypothetical protein
VQHVLDFSKSHNIIQYTVRHCKGVVTHCPMSALHLYTKKRISHIKKEPVLRNMFIHQCSTDFQGNEATGKLTSKFATSLVIGLFPYIGFSNKHSPCHTILHICKFLLLCTTYETGLFWGFIDLFNQPFVDNIKWNINSQTYCKMVKFSRNLAIYASSTLCGMLCTTLPSFYHVL